MVGWASEVVTEGDDFILGEAVWFGTDMRLERACRPFHKHGVTPYRFSKSTYLGQVWPQY